MNMDNRFKIHNLPPETATKKIGAGRLKGMLDIKPQWRIEALTHVYGLCGIGWYYETIERWIEDHAGAISAHVVIRLFIKNGDEWSKGIEGIGGSMLVAKEKNGPYHSDEAYKMATTDAISVCCKLLGIGHDIYMGYSDSKYIEKPDYMLPQLTQEEIEEQKRKEVEAIELNNIYKEIASIWTERKKLNTHPNEILASIKKEENLGVEKLTNCTNIEKLKAYKIKQANKLKEQQNKQEEV